MRIRNVIYLLATVAISAQITFANPVSVTAGAAGGGVHVQTQGSATIVE